MLSLPHSVFTACGIPNNIFPAFPRNHSHPIWSLSISTCGSNLAGILAAYFTELVSKQIVHGATHGTSG